MRRNPGVYVKGRIRHADVLPNQPVRLEEGPQIGQPVQAPMLNFDLTGMKFKKV